MQLPDFPSARLDGLRALVTGASGGIGAGAAVALARAGAEVLLVARRLAPMQEICAQLAAEGARARALQLDVTDRAAVRAALAGEPAFDVLVNNAGIAIRQGFLDLEDDALDAMIDLNLRAAVTVSQAVVRGMLAAGRRGAIIHIGSQAGHRASPQRAGYVATKHALEGLTKAMALELGAHGIRTNSICPTMVATPMTETLRANPKILQATERMIPLGRVLEVSDLGGAIVFLASPASAMINGVSLMVDGGMTVR